MPRKKAFNEEEVLDKALDVFWKNGYHATSVNDLVCALGINRASLYDTYGDKRSLYNQALEKYRSVNTDKLKAYFEDQSSVKDAFRGMFEMALIQDEDGNCGCFIVNSTAELLPEDVSINDFLDGNRKAQEAIFTEQIRKGQDSGELASSIDAQSLASIIFMINSGIRTTVKIKGSESSVSQAIEQAMNLFD